MPPISMTKHMVTVLVSGKRRGRCCFMRMYEYFIKKAIDIVLTVENQLPWTICCRTFKSSYPHLGSWGEGGRTHCTLKCLHFCPRKTTTSIYCLHVHIKGNERYLNWSFHLLRKLPGEDFLRMTNLLEPWRLFIVTRKTPNLSNPGSRNKRSKD